jgi:hypothetical protein
MAQNYSWNINYADVETNPSNGMSQIVTSCQWSANLTETDVVNGNNVVYTASTYGYATFAQPDPTKFVAFGQLKQADVLGWVWNTVDKNGVQAGLAAQITAQKNPPSQQLPIPQ